MPERTYGSEYERLVLTTKHPEPQYKPLERPPYIHSWLEERREEIVVVAFLACVFVYCSCVYAGVYTALLPFKKMVGQAWDVAALTALVLKFAPRKAAKRLRRPLYAAFVAVAGARFVYPTLYPKMYPWQP